MSGPETHSSILKLFGAWERLAALPFVDDDEMDARTEALAAIEAALRAQTPATLPELAAQVIAATGHGFNGLPEDLTGRLCHLAVQVAA